MTTAMNEILFTKSNGIGHVEFNRPASRNALTFDMYARLAEICRSAADDPSLRVLVISGAGGKAFAAGTDISLFRDFKGADSGLDYEHRMARHLGDIDACPLPLIAAISGACTGGGAAVAACCDLRIASADMKFGFPIARTLGNCLSAANLAKLSALIGPARVTDLIFTSRLMNAEEARSIGLVSEILPDHEAVVARGFELARTLLGNAPITLRVTKEALRRIHRDGAAAQDEDLVRIAYGSADFREGLDAFLSKRPPRWTGH